MVDISAWTNRFVQVLTETFGDRVWFVGLQGSYGRDEATDTSDIDVVTVLDELSAADIRAYKDMLDLLPHRELICGFLSGKAEILNWEPSELFQFCHDTKPLKGTLGQVLASVEKSAVDRAVKIGACGIYHGCVHNMLHENSEEILRGLYKTASFVVQAICFLQTGEYIHRQEDLLRIAEPGERTIIDTYLNMKNHGRMEFQKMSETLFEWSGKWIVN